LVTATVGMTANAAAVEGELAVVRPQDLDPDPAPNPAPNPVPDPPQKGKPEVVPGPNQNGTVVAVQNHKDKIMITGASEMGGEGRLSPPPLGFWKNRKSERNNLSPQFLDLPPPLQG